MARAFTVKTIENIKPNLNKRSEIPDPGLTGLYLVVQPSGAKSWAVRYRHAGKSRKVTLGRFPIMSLADARREASEALQAVELGRDPSSEKRRAKAERAQKPDRDQIARLVEQFDKRHLSTLKSGADVRRFLDRFMVEAWGDRDIRSITRRDIIELLDEIVDSGRAITANRVRAHMSKFFNWAVERDIIDLAPTLGVKPPVKENVRDRVLTDDEIRWFWAACEKAGAPWESFGKLLLLTGQRRREVSDMTEDEIRGNVWHLSAARTKNGRAHDVPLSDAALAVIASSERPHGSFGYIHTTTGETPISGFYKTRNNIAKHMAKIAEEERGEPVEIPTWSFHDLRRTAATGKARLGIPVRITEAVLNHVSGTGGGIVAVYQRHDYADEKKQALENWARFVISLVEGGEDNVVRIGAK